MAQPVWVSLDVVLALHDEHLSEHGGQPGIRARGLLESALMRPSNRLAYDPPTTIAALAASYAYGIVKNHPFLDGNKRTGLVAAETFLALNGAELAATDGECTVTFLRLAAGELTEEKLALWFDAHSRAD